MIYFADPSWSNWTERVVSEADHLLLLADVNASPTLTELEEKLIAFQYTSATTRQSLVLLREKDRVIKGSSQWLEARHARDHFHVQRGVEADLARLARILTGNAIAVVFGGGGARGYAHIGAIRALEEHGIPIDMIGGTSIGSIISAVYATGNDSGATLAACNRHFRRLFDFTFPMLSLITGMRIVTQLHNFFDGKYIEDLYLPCFCVSSNLTRAQPDIHRRGEVEAAIRASMSIPGFVPPVTSAGGLLNNLPVDIMRTYCGRGRIIAIDISPKVDMANNQEMPSYLSGWKLLFSRLSPFSSRHTHNIIAVLMRSMTLGAVNTGMRLQQQAHAGLYLLLPVEGVSTLDYDNNESISKLGYETSEPEIRKWWRLNRGKVAGQEVGATEGPAGVEAH